MEYNGTFSFKKIIGNRGGFAEIHIEVQLIPRKGKIANIDLDYNQEEEWRTALLYGAELFLNQCWKKDLYDIKVNVKEWNWLPQDTTSPIASFVMFQALCNALNIVSDIYVFNSELTSFVVKPW